MSGESEKQTEQCQENGVSCRLDVINTCLKNGLCEEDDVDLSCFLEAYSQLYNFFLLLGGAFQFMATDVKSKIKILEDLQEEEKEKNGEIKNFSSVKNMLVYEKGEKLLENQKYVSGSRTLLRLHRGLDFVRNFFKEIHNLEESASISGVCRETYDRTLAFYHTWIVRNSARLAMALLPTKEVLLKKMTKDNINIKAEAVNIMPELLETMKVTYDRVQKLYTEYELLNLP